MQEQYLALTDRILLLAYRLEHYRFTTELQRSRWLDEMNHLLGLRKQCSKSR